MRKRFIVVTVLGCLSIGVALMAARWNADLESDADAAVKAGHAPAGSTQPVEPAGATHVQGWWEGVFSAGSR